MSRKKHPPATKNDRYKQTDISTYFKVRNGASMAVIRRNEQFLVNKENDSEEVIVSPRKKPKPIASDDEAESLDVDAVINALLAPLDTRGSEPPPTCVKTPKPVLREYQLPLPLPLYTYSDESDSEVCSDGKTVSQPKSARKLRPRAEKTKGNSEPTSRVSSNKKSASVKPSIKKNLKTKPIAIITISSDDEFESSPNKIRKVEASPLSSKNFTSKDTTRKVEKYIADQGTGQSKSRKRLFDRNADTQTVLSVTRGAPLTCNTPEKLPEVLIGVYKPTVVATGAAKPKPRILQEKTKSDSSLPPSTSAEFISTDFVSQSEAALEVLSTSFQSSDSNNTVFCEKNINFTVHENGNSTPKKGVTILENLVISSPAKTQVTLEQCNLSPIKSNAKTEDVTEQSANSTKFKDERKTTWGLAKKTENSKKDEEHHTQKLFSNIIKYIGNHSHLKTMLTQEETQMLNKYFSMPRAEYRTVINMKLSDPEVKNMYDCLRENKFVKTDFSEEQCIDLLNYLSKKDLQDICESFRLKSPTERKSELIQRLLTNCNRQSTLTFSKSTEKILRDRITDKMGICVKLNPDLYKLFNKVHLLYTFTTSDFDKPNDLYFFMGKIAKEEIFMPKCNVNMNIEVFPSVAEFSRFAEACECKRSVQQSFEKKEFGHMLELCNLAYVELQEIFKIHALPRPSYMMRFTAGYKYTKALSSGAKYLARHFPEEVENWLVFLINQDRHCVQMRENWFDLLILVRYHYLKQYETAADTLIEALNRKDLSEVRIYELSCHRAELIKRSKVHKISELQHNRICFAQPAPLREPPIIEIDARAIRDVEMGRKGKRFYMEKTEGEKHIFTVEETALKHYFRKGYANGVHCEGSLLQTIFFILFWDIIYESPVPDAFILEIHYFPLDLLSPEFYTNRKKAIDRRLDEIRSKWPSDQLKCFICNMWEEHSHEKSYINDRLIDEPKQLYDIILCIGRVKLAHMLKRIAKDFKTYHSGLPDLFLWNVKQKTCKFVEVKGEKDKLSIKQRLWLHFLLSVGADAEVCHVHTVGSNTGRKLRKIKGEAKKEEKKNVNGA